MLLVERLRTQYPDTFTGLAFQQKGGFRIRALFSQTLPPQAAVDSAVREAGMTEPVQVAGAVWSRADEARLGATLMKRFRDEAQPISFSIDPEIGLITLHAAPNARLEAIAREVAGPGLKEVNFNPEGRVITTANSIAGQAWNASGGTYPNCTTGLSVINTASVRGATTAGHCRDNSPGEFNIYMDTVYGQSGGNKLIFQRELTSVSELRSLGQSFIL